MATVQCPCSGCEQIDHQSDYVAVRVNREEAFGYVFFTCDGCNTFNEYPVKPEIVELMIGEGIRLIAPERSSELDERQDVDDGKIDLVEVGEMMRKIKRARTLEDLGPEFTDFKDV